MSESDRTRRSSVLLLCDDDPAHAGNVLDHIDALKTLSRHDVVAFNPRVGDRGARLDVDAFDVVVIHYTIVITYDSYLPTELAERIARFDGLKVQFIQDEYRWVDQLTARMRELGINLLFSCVPQDVVPSIYGPRLPGVDVLTTLAGFVPEQLIGRPVPSLAERPLDIGYRGRAVPYWLGRLGQDKVEIARGFLGRAIETDLRVDIAWTESDRLYGERWIRFLSSCRATLGTASGASVIDFDGSVESRVHDYLAEHPAATFDEVEHEILHQYEGNAEINVVSPRVFEAAVLHTALVLFPGGYSGAIEPWTHYIPLERDLSNFDEVVERLRDVAYLDKLTDRAYADLVETGAYGLERFVEEFDDAVAERAEIAGRDARAPIIPASSRRMRRPMRRPGQARRAARRAASLAAIGRALAVAPEARRLLTRHARSQEARRLVSAERLREDVGKLAVLIAAQRGRVTMTTPFAIVPILDGRRLILASCPLETLNADRDDNARSAALTALREGRVNEIVWNHARFGQAAWLQLTPFRSAPVDVGYYGMYGAHHFSALERLRPVLPDAVVDGVAAVLAAPDARVLAARPAATGVTRAFAYAGASIRTARLALPVVARDPKSFAVRGLQAARFALRHRAVRALVRDYVAKPELRMQVHPLELLDDILKLQLVRSVRNSRDTHLSWEVDPRTGTLVFTTALGPPPEETAASPNGSLGEILHVEWDNSAIGVAVQIASRVETTLDDDGRHRFNALGEIIRRDETRLKDVLEVVLDSPRR